MARSNVLRPSGGRVASVDVKAISIPHVVRGEVVTGDEVEHVFSDGTVIATPSLDLDSLVWPRSELGPAFDVPIAEILDVLAALSEGLRNDDAGYLAEALEAMLSTTNSLGRPVLERTYAELWRSLSGDRLRGMLEAELGGIDVIDGWHPAPRPAPLTGQVRAFPPRLVHIMAGNTPGVAAVTIARGAMTKGVHLLKMASNDLFSATAILRTLADVAPGHAVTRSFSAVYWRGGDQVVESALFRPQFFDKLVAWGGEGAIRGALRYIGPGFELVSFDPKDSISFVGREAFASNATLAEAADAAAVDVTVFNQEACVASRFIYVEGSVEDADRFCEALVGRLEVERPTSSATGPQVPSELREEIQGLALLDDLYRVWGRYDGTGLVIRSDEPVGFQPSGKAVNVVPVDRLRDAVAFANAATQTVGVYPPERKAELRDPLASAGVQRVVTLGKALGGGPGLPHDGFYPMHRFVKWVADED